MRTIPLIELAWELKRAGMKPDAIAERVGKHRATVYRWLTGIRLYGIREYVRRYTAAKKGRRQKRKTDPVIKQRIYAIREEFHHCCGEKIRYWMLKRYGASPSRTTIYRILAEKYHLRSKWKKNQARGPVPAAEKPRQVIQTDTVDFGEVFAYGAIDICTREAMVVLATELDARFGAWALKQQMAYFGHVDLIQRDGGPEFKDAWEEMAPQFATTVRTARPYKKNEQAFIESFNRTLRKECLGWLKYKQEHLPVMQQRLHQFLHFYNTERPHLSLAMKAPRDVCRI
jgi:transposase InsO family protein